MPAKTLPQFERNKPKGTCPKCGHKKKWRYYEDANGDRMDEQFGRCERSNSCGHHNAPSGITPKRGIIAEQRLPDVILPTPERTEALRAKTRDHSSNLHAYALTLGIPAEHLQKWGVATDGGKVVYLYQNGHGELVNAKWFSYLPSGKREKGRGCDVFSFKQPDEKFNQRYGFCLYGEHLLSSDHNRIICVVESEKSAVLASHFYPEFDWLACGSANGLSTNRIGCLYNRAVYWICDADGNEPLFHGDGSPKLKRDGSPELSEGGRRNSSLRNLKGHGITHAVIDLFPQHKDGYDLADALQDGLRPIIASPKPLCMTATPTLPSLLTSEQQLLVRNQSAKGIAREQIAALLTVHNPSQLAAYAADIDALLDGPEPQIQAAFFEMVPARKAGTFELSINRAALRDFYIEHGLAQISDSAHNDKPMMVHVEDNIVSEVGRVYIKQYVLRYVDSLPPYFNGTSRKDLLCLILDKNKGLFDSELLHFLPPLEGAFMRDDQETAWLFFANGWVTVKANSRKLRPYSELPGLIWKSQILRHHYEEVAEAEYLACDFGRFINNVMGADPVRVRAAHLALGYLLHTYKDDSNARVVVFMDRMANLDDSEGRTGKNLFARACGQILRMVDENGRNFKFDNDFKWQKVQRDTQLFFFDEWASELPFDRLYTEITGNWTVNAKNKPSFTLPFESSPKIVIATNAVVGGIDKSTEGRKVEIALDPYYDNEKQPASDFEGRRFFGSDWDKHGNEWQKFINLAIGWIQLFLQNNRQLESVRLVEVETRRLEQNTLPGFLPFLNRAIELAEQNNVVNSKGFYCLWMEETYERYLKETKLSTRDVSVVKFGKSMRKSGLELGRETTRKSARYDEQFYSWGVRPEPLPE